MSDLSDSADATRRTSEAPLAHVMPLQLLWGVFGTLVLLTVLTVIAAQCSLGAWEVWVSLGIATLKAGLVGTYFMHLRYDRPFNSLVLLAAVLFVVLFLGLTLMDLKR
jgi:cytochrome c oxidase subunit 4